MPARFVARRRWNVTNRPVIVAFSLGVPVLKTFGWVRGSEAVENPRPWPRLSKNQNPHPSCLSRLDARSRVPAEKIPSRLPGALTRVMPCYAVFCRVLPCFAVFCRVEPGFYPCFTAMSACSVALSAHCRSGAPIDSRFSVRAESKNRARVSHGYGHHTQNQPKSSSLGAKS